MICFRFTDQYGSVGWAQIGYFTAYEFFLKTNQLNSVDQ